VSVRYESRVSDDVHDPSWREFLREAPAGHYMQSGEWAEFKAAFNWKMTRLMLSRGEEVQSGVQMLLRRIPALGTIGWATKAPVLREPDPEVIERTLEGLRRLAKRNSVRVLMLQPPSDEVALLDALSRWGYEPSPVQMAPAGTIRIDLRASTESIQADMRAKTRQHIRKGLRAGVTVREGSEGDLDTFYQLHMATGRRQSFSPYPLRHFTTLWRVFRPTGGVRLFLAEHDGEPLSGLVLLIHGDTVYAHAMGWSGRHPQLMANEVLYWSAISWSKAEEYRAWDFTWIDSRAADAIASGQPLPEDLRKSVTFFKLGFGGTVTMFPGAYDYVASPALRVAFRALVPPVYRLKSVRKAQRRLRWRWVPHSARVASDSSPSNPPAA
jgi:peptidoglycan pentaglycine glycine transferase (the first glycine)